MELECLLVLLGPSPGVTKSRAHVYLRITFSWHWLQPQQVRITASGASRAQKRITTFKSLHHAASNESVMLDAEHSP